MMIILHVSSDCSHATCIFLAPVWHYAQSGHENEPNTFFVTTVFLLCAH